MPQARHPRRGLPGKTPCGTSFTVVRTERARVRIGRAGGYGGRAVGDRRDSPGYGGRNSARESRRERRGCRAHHGGEGTP